MKKYVSHEYKKGDLPFTNTFLKKLVSYYNKTVLKKSEKIKKDADLYKQLNQKMKKYKAGGKYWLWPYIIRTLNTDPQIRLDIKKFENRELLPEKPASWYKNPKSWLSNFDIQNVMVQYQKCKKYNYNFLGVFPIDFSSVNENGTCRYSSMCFVDIKKMSKKYSFIGFITNLDKHDEPGSHWTSSFIVINPELKTYGAYYYDSVGKDIPVYLNGVFNSIQSQCNQINKKQKFTIHVNKKQHQFKDTECGIFSIIFQVRWLNKHIVKKNNTSFDEIVSNPYIDDEHMLKIRNTLFRPNSSVEMKHIKI